MHRVVRLLLVLAVSFSFTACGPSQSEQQANAQAARERQAREAAERAARDAQQGKSTWQTVAFVVGIGAVLFLVFGTALGSSARKHAKKQKDQQNQ